MKTINTLQDADTNPPTSNTVNEGKILPYSKEEINKDIDRVKEIYQQLNKLASKSLKLILEAGQILSKLKLDTPHGEWQSYVKNHLGLHPRTASNYMRLWNEATKIETLPKLIKSESISDLGIRQALDFLQQEKKSFSTSNKNTTSKKELTTQQESLPNEALCLADQSQLTLKKINWQEGFISKSTLDSALSNLVTHSASPNEKLTARTHRFVAEISASINRSAGKASHESATKIAIEALETVIEMISKSNTPSSSSPQIQEAVS